MLHVAVGVVIRPGNEILVAKRLSESDHGGLWEFPGGKVEANEGVYDALCRELKEEVNLEVLSAFPLIQVPYCYEKYDVRLDVWNVEHFSGEARGVEGQMVCWVHLQALKTLKMPEANQAIIDAILQLNATTT